MLHLTCQTGSLEDRCSVLAAFIRENADAMSRHAAALPGTESGGPDNAFLVRFQPEFAALLDAIATCIHGAAGATAQYGGGAASLAIRSERCAAGYLAGGFSEVQLVQTFQGLRNIVLQRWIESLTEIDASVIVATTRMQQAFDMASCAAVDHYCHLKDRCHGLFLKTLAHDFRNHLGGLELANQILQQNTAMANGGLYKIASSMSRSVDNVTRVACDIQDIGNLREGQGISVNRVELDGSALCRRLVDEFISCNPDQVIVLEAEGALMGKIDESRMSQALANLIGYAVRHSVKGNPVTVSLRGEPGSLMFSVRYLSAFPVPVEAGAMFAPMRLYAAHLLSKKEPVVDLGVHLYIAREIIMAHDGELDAVADQGWVSFEARLR